MFLAFFGGERSEIKVRAANNGVSEEEDEDEEEEEKEEEGEEGEKEQEEEEDNVVCEMEREVSRGDRKSRACGALWLRRVWS
jgi:hypothetical protein